MLSKITKKDKRTKLEKEIDSVIDMMGQYDPSSNEYTAITENLEKLKKATSYERDRHASPDTKWLVACNLLGLVTVLFHERANIITSKAFGWIMRGRI